jgi:hypothetical protein
VSPRCDLIYLQYFPFKTSPNPRPYVKVYIGRDLAQDMVGKQLAGLYADRPKRADYAAVVENAQAAYREECESRSLLPLLNI